MKISRALKQKSRLHGEIKVLKERLASCVSVLDENEYVENFKELLKEIDKKQNDVISLSNRIMAANIKGNMFGHILRLSQLKQNIDIMRKIQIRSGVEVESYREGKNKYKSQVTEAERRTIVDGLQKDIENLTDQLDDFNAKTDIE